MSTTMKTNKALRAVMAAFLEDLCNEKALINIEVRYDDPVQRLRIFPVAPVYDRVIELYRGYSTGYFAWSLGLVGIPPIIVC